MDKELWVYDLRTNKHFTLKQNPLRRADLDDFVACYNPADRHQRQESERFKRYPYEDLIARDKTSLDLFLAPRREPRGHRQPPTPGRSSRRNSRRPPIRPSRNPSPNRIPHRRIQDAGHQHPKQFRNLNLNLTGFHAGLRVLRAGGVC